MPTLQENKMITKSTMYAVTENGKCIFKGSAASARKIWKAKRKENPGNNYTLWNSPSSKVGDYI